MQAVKSRCPANCTSVTVTRQTKDTLGKNRPSKTQPLRGGTIGGRRSIQPSFLAALMPATEQLNGWQPIPPPDKQMQYPAD